MAQFDVFRNPNPATRKVVPYVLELQSELHAAMDSRVVAPLKASAERRKLASKLEPSFDIEGNTVWMATADLTSMPIRLLKTPCGSLLHARSEILAAVDQLFFGI